MIAGPPTRRTPALDHHIEMFGRAPDVATADRGLSSAANEEAAVARGVRRVVLPHLGEKRRRGARTSGSGGFAVERAGA